MYGLLSLNSRSLIIIITLAIKTTKFLSVFSNFMTTSYLNVDILFTNRKSLSILNYVCSYAHSLYTQHGYEIIFSKIIMPVYITPHYLILLHTFFIYAHVQHNQLS